MCVLTNKMFKRYWTDFCSDTWVMPQGFDYGAAGVCRGQKISNMVKMHIKLARMMSRIECK